MTKQHIFRGLRPAAYALAATLTLTACAPEPASDDIVQPSAGSLNAQKYVAVGTSLTAGYGDNALYRSGQENSFPAILGRQLQTVGGGAVNQPLMAATSNTLAQGQGYAPGATAATGRLYVSSFTNGTPVLTVPPSQYGSNASAALAGFLNDRAGIPATGSINNWGVPGIRIPDVVTPGYGSAGGLVTTPATANPYYVRMLGPTGGMATVLESVVATSPSFLTIELGANDVLGYALSGGTGSSAGLASPGYIAVAQGALTTIVNTLLTGNQRQAVLFRVPDPRVIPYLTTIGPQVAQNATRLGLPSTQKLFFLRGATLDSTTVGALSNPYVNSAPLITLPSSALFANINPSNPATIPGLLRTNPIPDGAVLDPVERQNIQTMLDAYNSTINALANTYTGRTVVFDVGQWQSQFIYRGQTVTVDGYPVDNRFVQGGLYALDGVHLTPRGYAFAANAVIRLLNQRFNARIATVNPLDYPGTLFPSSN